MIRDGLYHADIGLPWALLPSALSTAKDLEYGPHARSAAISDRCGRLTAAPLRRALHPSEIFEVEVEQGEVVKVCARLSDGFQAEAYAPVDLILVLTPSRRNAGSWFVKTLWFNFRNDKHKTLDRSKYQTL